MISVFEVETFTELIYHEVTIDKIHQDSFKSYNNIICNMVELPLKWKEYINIPIHKTFHLEQERITIRLEEFNFVPILKKKIVLTIVIIKKFTFFHFL